MKKYIFILLATVLAWTSCNDDFLEKYPVESLTEATAFSTYGNFKRMPGHYMVYSTMQTYCGKLEVTDWMVIMWVISIPAI